MGDGGDVFLDLFRVVLLLVSLPGEASQSDKLMFKRYDDKDIAGLDKYDLPDDELEPYKAFAKSASFALELSKFLKAEGAVAMVRKSYRENGLVTGEGYNIDPANRLALPFMELQLSDRQA